MQRWRFGRAWGWGGGAAWVGGVNDDDVDGAMGGVQAKRGHDDGWRAPCMRIARVVVLFS